MEVSVQDRQAKGMCIMVKKKAVVTKNRHACVPRAGLPSSAVSWGQSKDSVISEYKSESYV